MADTTVTQETTIAPARADVVRTKMMDKNTLTEMGSIPAAGEGVDTVNATNIKKMTQIVPGTKGLPLVSGGTGAIPAYAQLGNEGIADDSITESQINSESKTATTEDLVAGATKLATAGVVKTAIDGAATAGTGIAATAKASGLGNSIAVKGMGVEVGFGDSVTLTENGFYAIFMYSGEENADSACTLLYFNKQYFTSTHRAGFFQTVLVMGTYSASLGGAPVSSGWQLYCTAAGVLTGHYGIGQGSLHSCLLRVHCLAKL